jgi:hypothetical protein
MQVGRDADKAEASRGMVSVTMADLPECGSQQITSPSYGKKSSWLPGQGLIKSGLRCITRHL